ncbi:histidine phosphatase family protein, partial [Nocardioides hankookensis]
ETGEVLGEDGSTIGVASNNVAEYSGLVAGLRLAAALAPGAEVEVRMDSKLVVEQMSGRWKIKHPDMQALAEEARELAPAGTTYTWIPREQNKHADRLVNEALDGKRAPRPEPKVRAWGPPSVPTTVILVRHGVTPHTVDKRFSGGLASANPGLSDDGKDQIRAVADWLGLLADRIDAVIASPVRRTLESAEIIAEALGREVEVEPGFAEMEFGTWDGMTFAEVGERFPDDLKAWLGSLDVAPGGGESFRVVEERVLAGLERVLEAYAGRTVVVVSHVTPIKTLVAHALDAPLDAVYRMELTPASVTVLNWYDDRPSMRLYNALPPGHDPLATPR